MPYFPRSHKAAQDQLGSKQLNDAERVTASKRASSDIDNQKDGPATSDWVSNIEVTVIFFYVSCVTCLVPFFSLVPLPQRSLVDIYLTWNIQTWISGSVNADAPPTELFTITSNQHASGMDDVHEDVPSRFGAEHLREVVRGRAGPRRPLSASVEDVETLPKAAGVIEVFVCEYNVSFPNTPPPTDLSIISQALASTLTRVMRSYYVALHHRHNPCFTDDPVRFLWRLCRCSCPRTRVSTPKSKSGLRPRASRPERACRRSEGRH